MKSNTINTQNSNLRTTSPSQFELNTRNSSVGGGGLSSSDFDDTIIKMKNCHDELILLLSQMSLFLQSAAVTTSCRDSSFITYITHLMLSVTLLSSNYHSVRDLHNIPYTATTSSSSHSLSGHTMKSFQ